MTLATAEPTQAHALAAGLKLIDDALVAYAAKNLVATAEVTNTLLDIRQIILANMPID